MIGISESEVVLKQKLSSIFSSKEFVGCSSSDFELSSSLNLRQMEFRPAAVLIPVLFNNGEPSVVLTKRTKNLKEHPGQIAFPGGKVEESDYTETETVARECFEEIYLKASDLNVLGMLPKHYTLTGYSITPFVGLIKNYDKLKPQLSEVSEIFKVPLKFLLNKENMRFQKARFNGRQGSYYTIPYGPYYIWGATARIIKTFAEVIEKYETA